MSDDVIDRLRRENPLPETMPALPIEPVLRRIDTDSPTDPPGDSVPLAGRPTAVSHLGGAIMLAASVAVVIAVGAILIVGHGQTRPNGQPQPAAGGPSRTVPSVLPNHASVKIDPAVASEFSVLRSPHKATDILPAALSAALRNYWRLGPEPRGARRVMASNGETAYLVPAKQGACAVTSFSAICAPTAVLSGAYSLDLCSPTLPPGQIELQWLVPDDATNVTVRLANGDVVTWASGYNVYVANIRTKTVPKSIDWDQRDQHHSVSLGGIGGGQVGKCTHPSNLPPASQLPKAPPGSVTTMTKTATAKFGLGGTATS